jgi:predicted O-linked N-acetylglucosamine transferase (SPINDLY family)
LQDYTWVDEREANSMKPGKTKPMLQTQPPAVEVNPLVSLYNAGRYAELENKAKDLVGKYPDFGFGWKLLGGALLMQGKNALPAFQKTAELMPNEADAHFNLGVALRSSGRLADAAASYRRALQIKPDYAEVHSNLGNTLKDLGQLDDAVASLRHAVKLKPDFVLAHINLGVVLQRLGKTAEAAASYRQALALKPDNAVVHNDLGNVLLALGQISEAIASYRRAIEIKPDFALAYNNLGNPLKNLGRYEEAIASYRRAIEIKPDFAEAYCNLATALRSQGDLSAARECYRKAQESGYKGARVCDALMLPAIMGTRQEVMESRAEFDRNLDKLIEDRVTLDDPLVDVDETNFYLAYHASNDRELQIKVAKFYEQACPSLLYTAPHCLKPRRESPKVRVGFLSRYLYSHPVSQCFSKIIEAISLNEQFEVSLISNLPVDKNCYSGFAGQQVRLPYNLKLARERLAALELDILVYLDIGMEPLSYFLAFSRLARAQCVMAGHPVTTGITNMDYFLSCGLMEPPEADEHYSEKLVRLPRPPAYLARPALPTTLKTRAELGLPEGRHIYMCPMKLQKLHPDFDEAITRILQLDDQGVVVLFEDYMSPYWKKAILKRFESTVPAEVRERILFLPWLKDHADFVSAIATADVVLDPFHFGIGSTAAVISITGTPLLTKEGEFMRGRVGTFYCRLLGLEECIAKDTEAYASKAVEIASNPSLRDTIRTKILKNGHLLYDNMQPAEDLVDFFHSLAGS